jgi:NAD(P)-dependent dehydrogenase (short-subunit alcohol dehydrogenase family)
VAEAWEVSDYRKTTGTAEEVAEAVLFLASARTTYVLGEFIEVNGGQLMD